MRGRLVRRAAAATVRLALTAGTGPAAATGTGGGPLGNGVGARTDSVGGDAVAPAACGAVGTGGAGVAAAVGGAGVGAGGGVVGVLAVVVVVLEGGGLGGEGIDSTPDTAAPARAGASRWPACVPAPDGERCVVRHGPEEVDDRGRVLAHLGEDRVALRARVGVEAPGTPVPVESTS